MGSRSPSWAAGPSSAWSWTARGTCIPSGVPSTASWDTIPTGSSSRGRSASSTTASCCRGAWRSSWSAPRTGRCCPCPTSWSGTWPAGPTTRYGNAG
ncbi:hypothetical protein RLOC_00000633 [Lonchura striata]|uniref:Uncharacterized protein n=1 Tax=Lonchura striata TaxID=40157 RepID=A0A218U941_9PASE|nr:hypothetical protein RLOC_00000633 [Lonchura striata domestica]